MRDLINRDLMQDGFTNSMRRFYPANPVTLRHTFKDYTLGKEPTNPHRKFLTECLKKIEEQHKELAEFILEKADEHNVHYFIENKIQEDE